MVHRLELVEQNADFNISVFVSSLKLWVRTILIAEIFPSKVDNIRLVRERADYGRGRCLRLGESKLRVTQKVTMSVHHLCTQMLKPLKEFMAQRLVRGACLLATDQAATEEYQFKYKQLNVRIPTLQYLRHCAPFYTYKPSLRGIATALSKAVHLPLPFPISQWRAAWTLSHS